MATEGQESGALGNLAGFILCSCTLGFIIMACWCIAVATEKDCDTQLLADVDRASFLASNYQWMHTGKRGQCTVDLSFWYEGQLYKTTFSSECNSCQELEGAPGTMPVCFIGSPETSPVRLIKGDNYVKAHGMYSKHKQWQLKVALTVFGVMIGVGVMMLCLADCIHQMLASYSRVSPTSLEESQHCCGPEEPTWRPAKSTTAEQGMARCPLATNDVLAADQQDSVLELTGLPPCSAHNS